MLASLFASQFRKHSTRLVAASGSLSQQSRLFVKHAQFAVSLHTTQRKKVEAKGKGGVALCCVTVVACRVVLRRTR